MGDRLTNWLIICRIALPVVLYCADKIIIFFLPSISEGWVFRSPEARCISRGVVLSVPECDGMIRGSLSDCARERISMI